MCDDLITVVNNEDDPSKLVVLGDVLDVYAHWSILLPSWFFSETSRVRVRAVLHVSSGYQATVSE